MNNRIDRVNSLRKAKGLKPTELVEDIVKIVKELPKIKTPFDEILDIEKSNPKKKKKKKEVIVETKEEVNSDSLFETNPEPLNKKEDPKEEILNED